MLQMLMHNAPSLSINNTHVNTCISMWYSTINIFFDPPVFVKIEWHNWETIWRLPISFGDVTIIRTYILDLISKQVLFLFFLILLLMILTFLYIITRLRYVLHLYYTLFILRNVTKCIFSEIQSSWAYSIISHGPRRGGKIIANLME